MTKEITYKEAFEELQTIAQNIESDELEVDKLAEKIKRATLLVQICKDKLREIEEEINIEIKDK